MNDSTARIARLLAQRNALAISVLAIVVVLVCLTIYSIMGYFNPIVQNILQGVIGSLVAAIAYWFLFQSKVEPNLTEAAMLSASESATKLTLSHLRLVPTAIYAGGDKSDTRFENHLSELLLESGPSGTYYFLGESAFTASSRLLQPVWQSLLSNLQTVNFIVTDPSDNQLLETQARHRLGRLFGDYDVENIKVETRRIKFSVYKTIENIIPYISTGRYDLTFVNGHSFFRAELLSNGLFLAYYDKTKVFTQTAFYPNASSVYRAHQRNITHHFNWPSTKFRLKASGARSLSQVLDALRLSTDFADYEEWKNLESSKKI